MLHLAVCGIADAKLLDHGPPAIATRRLLHLEVASSCWIGIISIINCGCSSILSNNIGVISVVL